jgi:hypothetical protein
VGRTFYAGNAHLKAKWAKNALEKIMPNKVKVYRGVPLVSIKGRNEEMMLVLS